RPREVDLGRVLHQQYDLLCGHPLLGLGDVRFDHVIERDLIVVEEAIGGLHLRSTAGGRRNAQIGPVSQLGQQGYKSIVQALISEIRLRGFLLGPRRDHGATPLTQVLQSPSVSYYGELSSPDYPGEQKLVGNNEADPPGCDACAKASVLRACDPTACSARSRRRERGTRRCSAALGCS